MATKITPEDIKKINNLYFSIGTYAGVARELGISAGTVKKYVIPGYEPVIKEIEHFYITDMNETPDPSSFICVMNFGDLCVLTDEEKEEMKVLWDEMEI